MSWRKEFFTKDTMTHLVCNCSSNGSDYGAEVNNPFVSDEDNFILIVIGCGMACLIFVVFLVLSRLRRARSSRGTYSPAAQEMFGKNAVIVILKQPPEERLI